MARKLYELFLEKSGLTPDEAIEFLDMKHKEMCPIEPELTKKQIKSNEKLSREARAWKKSRWA